MTDHRLTPGPEGSRQRRHEACTAACSNGCEPICESATDSAPGVVMGATPVSQGQAELTVSSVWTIRSTVSQLRVVMPLP